MTADVGEGKPGDPGAGSHRGDERWGCQPFIRNAAARNIAEACGPPPETEPGHPPHRPSGSKQQDAQSNPAIPFGLGDVEAGNFEVWLLGHGSPISAHISSNRRSCHEVVGEVVAREFHIAEAADRLSVSAPLYDNLSLPVDDLGGLAGIQLLIHHGGR